ncbi:Crp/Fnr family transcriptional regulator [Carboxylicivirga caseinilyticus]|uniref:Crp/Fnr family transcriptional regulator n=1 Tax=Carboxylicivirga caseinilyticus TaxID=3417572 RepID=UPI003D341141|nr:Crp/Fnr family transcriptional regulator [Marinilabiliaceae bacterium A049]
MQISLSSHIKNYIELNESEEQLLEKYIKSRTIKKKEHLLLNGQVCRSLFFVEKGCLRMYYINSKASEQITQFAIEGWWLADYNSFMENQPSEYNIQAIEASKIISIDIQQFDNLLKELPQLERYFRIIMQKNLAASQQRNKYLYEMSKEEFYLHFSTSFPQFVQRVPQYMIASYLGLTPEYVSELRKKK